jgi:hypothetical protein
MQKTFMSHKFVVAGVLPVMLSMLVAVSATASAGVPISKNPAPAQHKETVKSKAAPATKTDSAKPSSGNKEADSKDKEKNKAADAKAIEADIASATPIDPLELLKQPSEYLNKKVTFTATFNRFADIALDYKKAFRDSRDYVTFFVLRPDTTDHTIPLAEMKLFFPRKKSDEVMDLEAGDKIQIVGTQFSTALDEPWIDVAHVKILEKTAKPEKKHQPEF